MWRGRRRSDIDDDGGRGSPPATAASLAIPDDGMRPPGSDDDDDDDDDDDEDITSRCRRWTSITAAVVATLLRPLLANMGGQTGEFKGSGCSVRGALYYVAWHGGGIAV